MSVLDVLRDEVGFHCPAVSDDDICGSPYLTWHHFDPTWRVEHHHRPEGMIALCREHADKADNGSYSNEQLRRFKMEGKGRGQHVSGRFDWMRQDLLAVVGGNAYLQTPVIVRVADRNVIWFGRNEHNELLLNFDMPTLSGEPRAKVRDNTWMVAPHGATRFECPPSGRRLRVQYSNGDLFHVEFSSVSGLKPLRTRLPSIMAPHDQDFDYPLTVVEISQTAAGSYLQLSPDRTLIGTNSIQGSLFSNCGVGIQIDEPTPVMGVSSASRVLSEARKHPRFRS